MRNGENGATMPNAGALVDAAGEIEFACPNCQERYSDALELLRPGTLERIVCAGCGAPFFVLLLECASCAEETVFCWAKPPVKETLTQLFCMNCGKGRQA